METTKPKVESKGLGKEPATAREFFEDFQKSADTPEGRREAAEILKALDAGNPNPARDKIESMIKVNLGFIERNIPHDLPGVIGSETHEERIGRFKRYLKDLE